MSRAEDQGRSFDWRAWVTLGWVAWFGLLYLRMLVEQRAPGLLAALRGLVGG